MPTVLVVVAFLTRLVPVLRGGGLSGHDTYDPSVYYAAAVGLFFGRLPYRDFLLLHPPGILLVLQPFAALGAVVGDPSAVASARVAFMGMGALSTYLIFSILRRRGVMAAAVGAGLYAVWFPALVVERTTRLEGVLTVLLLGAVALLTSPRMRPSGGWPAPMAGALLGFAATVKIWGVVPLAVVVGWLLARRAWQPAVRLALGALVAMSVVIAPFAAIGGRRMWQMVVTDQLGRGHNTDPLALRVNDIVGLGQLSSDAVPLWATVVGIAIVVVCGALAAWSSDGRLAALLLLATGATLFASPSWFAHYPAFCAAPVALVVGHGVARISSWPLPRAAGRVAGTALALLLAGTAAVQLSLTDDGSPFPGQELGAILASRPGCITTDNPVSLILSDTLRRNLRDGCPLVVDLGGYIFDVDHGGDRVENRAGSAAFQGIVLDYLRTGRSAIVMRLWPWEQNGMSTATESEVLSWRVVGMAGRFDVREPSPGGLHRAP